MAAPRKMKYVRLGNLGLKVSRIILGCMSYGDPKWGGSWVLPEEEGTKHIKAAYDAGINTFDMANACPCPLPAHGKSWVVRSRNTAPPRDEIVVMTKPFMAVPKTDTSEATLRIPDLDTAGYVNQYGLSRKYIFESVKHSLRRLDLDYIDVLQCHRFDPNTPIEETVCRACCPISTPHLGGKAIAGRGRDS
ncbi:Aldo-ket-red domain-containing protein [Mycena venus]|uniref:Aldo-ket-red domain-containing protein n=1 Tax=Mycena venus TaxID=2733690 RepID=A0A8H6U365_9AGAR|nr:Aldo-ket-red domain-containing protein [Mycena venus]